MSVVDEVRTKGSWETIIRPRAFLNGRVADLLSVPDQLANLSIQRRGWYFHHVDRSAQPDVGNDWVGQETKWRMFREVWRVTGSGQFVHVAGFRYDWGEPRDYLAPMQEIVPEGALMGMGDTLHRLSEIVEFAQRWMNHIRSSEGVSLNLKITGLVNRQLVVDNPARAGISATYMSRAPEPFTWDHDIEPGESLQELWRGARSAATKLFERFGFRANEQVLEDWQSKIGG